MSLQGIGERGKKKGRKRRSWQGGLCRGDNNRNGGVFIKKRDNLEVRRRTCITVNAGEGETGKPLWCIEVLHHRKAVRGQNSLSKLSL